jgi:hypothetical protein
MHCENCGREDPEVFDGYTACCNELVCYGDDDTSSPFGTTPTWAVEFDDGRPPVGIKACCSARAWDDPRAAGSSGGHMDCSGCQIHRGNTRMSGRW